MIIKTTPFKNAYDAHMPSALCTLDVGGVCARRTVTYIYIEQPNTNITVKCHFNLLQISCNYK
eukprot:3501498-Pleurochrysis_carterae.AAC.1